MRGSDPCDTVGVIRSKSDPRTNFRYGVRHYNELRVRSTSTHPCASIATAPALTSASGVVPPPTAPAASTAQPGNMRSETKENGMIEYVGTAPFGSLRLCVR